MENLRPGFFRDQPVTLVPVYTFDWMVENVLKEMGMEVGIIKIDVEGAEMEVLKGMSETIRLFRPVIICEVLYSYSEETVSVDRLRREELSDFLKEAGYYMVQIQRRPENRNQFDLVRIREFPVHKWNKNSRLSSNYLFLPMESSHHLITRLGITGIDSTDQH
jgi:hypothetical protein